MSTPPFITSGRRQPRRRRRRLGVGAGVAILLAAAVAAWLLLLSGGSPASPRHAHPHIRVAVVVAPRSAAGLPLAPAAFALHGVGAAASDPVGLVFHHPPRAGLLFDLDTGRVLWQRNAALRLPIASLTKMMTALLAIGSGAPDAPVLVTRQAVAEGGSKVGVLPLGRHVPLESLLYGLLLPSGNDAAVALAQHAAGSITAFVARMNAEAAALGMSCTRYSSPSGFYDAGNFSCPADLALLAHVDLGQPRIASVTRTFTATLPFPIHGGKLYLVNNNPLLIYGYPGVTGMKTGYTEAAGRCLVATAERHGVRLGVVLLNSDAPGTQARKLLDAAFRHVYGLAPVPEPPMPADA